MVDTLKIYEKLKQVLEPDAAETIAEIIGETMAHVQESMSEKWFQRLDSEISAVRQAQRAFEEQLARSHEQFEQRFARIETVLAELAEAQKRLTEEFASYREASEARFARIEATLAELAEAQKRTEEAVAKLTQRMDELAEAQKRTEEAVAKLTQRVDELDEAQRRSAEEFASYREASEARFARIEATLAELAEAQKRTEEAVAKLTQRMDELAEAQRRTEEEIRRLTEEMRDIRRQMGGIAMTVGYGLGDRAYPALPALLLRDYGIEVVERLKRQFVQDREGQYIEVNIFGEAKRNGEVLTIVGESKAQLSKNDVDNFVRRKLSRLKEVYPELFPVLVTFMTTEWDVEEYARAQGIAVYYSYDF